MTTATMFSRQTGAGSQARYLVLRKSRPRNKM